jgi:TolB-like protein/Tfp pilus assembly protein PilF
MSTLRIGDRSLDLSLGELLDEHGTPIDVRRQSLSVLVCLARSAGRVVSKEQIIEEVWNGAAVTDDSIVQCIGDIRRALGTAGKTNLITLPRRGYRLIVDNIVYDDFTSVDRKKISNFGTEMSVLQNAQPSIAVLPFIALSRDPDCTVIAEGISEDIITSLSRLSWLFVIARTSSFHYKGKQKDVREIAEELGVRYIIEGSLREIGSDLRLTTKLIDATNSRSLWVESYDCEVSDLFKMQDKITRNVTTSLHTQIQLTEGSLASRLATDIKRDPLPVWVQLSKAWSQVYQMTEASLEEARDVAEQCLIKYSDSSRAYQILSSALFHRAWMGFSQHAADDYSEALKFAERAVLHDPQNEYAHWILGLCRMVSGDHDRAMSTLEHSIYLNPNCSLAYGSLATAQNFAGFPALAIANNEFAIQTNPKDPSIYYRYAGLSLSYYLEERFDLAVSWARKAIAVKPVFAQVHLTLIASLTEAGMIKEACAAFNELKYIYPSVTLDLPKNLPFRQVSHRERLIASLQMAGLTC